MSDLVCMPSLPSLHKIRPADLPAPPQSAMAMLRACSSDEVDNKRLAEFTQTDPVLAAEVLRVVNTPWFGVAREVTSVRHAIGLLGVRALRNIVLCLMVREAIQVSAAPGLELTLFWEDTLRRAAAARALAPRFGLDKEDAFTAGLLQDFGLLILFYLHPEVAGEFARLRRQDPVQRYQSEKSLFIATHDEILMMLVTLWSLPESLAKAIGQHHRPDMQRDKLSQLLYACDWVNAIYCVGEIGPVLEQVQQLLAVDAGMTPAQLEQLLNELPHQVTDAAVALGLRIPLQTEYGQVLRQANSVLAKENTDYQELTWKLERAIAERDRLAAELNQEIAIAQEIQQRLMPDGDCGLPVYGLSVPARNISGDFFDYQRLGDGSVFFALGDVSGKGINAGLLMAKTAGLFHCLAKHATDPAQLLAIINDEICETSVRGFFVTMIAGIYRPSSHQVRLVNAGHLPALVIGPHRAPSWLEATEQPLGILPGSLFTLSEPIDLHGAALYLYSDGITESRKADGTMLGSEGLAGLIQQNLALGPGQRLHAVVEAIRPSQQLHDDITLLVVGDQS